MTTFYIFITIIILAVNIEEEKKLLSEFGLAFAYSFLVTGIFIFFVRLGVFTVDFHLGEGW